MTTDPMTPNVECASCGKELYRNFSEQKQSKSGLYFCRKFCKSIFYTGDKLCSVPKENPIFQAMMKVYDNYRERNRESKEYLTGIYLIRIDPKHKEYLGDYII